MTENSCVHIVGGGLAGCEAAWQVLQEGLKVVLYEMRPQKKTPAHQTGHLAELVCSNSFKSKKPESASGLLKKEMQAFKSLVVEAAYQAEVPAGDALAVERSKFSAYIKEALSQHENFSLVEKEVSSLPSQQEMQESKSAWIIATGPLTSELMAKELGNLSGGQERLFFYDAIAPIIAAETLDESKGYWADRYSDQPGDYFNIPLDKEQYESLIEDILTAEMVPLQCFEKTSYFEACLPIEVMAERGKETLRFGPLKPVGLEDPRTAQRPYAVIQLRKENKQASMLSMVGFQTKMKWPEQKRVFTKLAALKDAEFLRFGSIHRNTYLKSPEVLAKDLSFKEYPRVFLAGQVSGVEGYLESAAIGLLAARSAVAKLKKVHFIFPPASSVLGALAQYITFGAKSFAPMNANLGLLDLSGYEITQEKKVKRLSRAERKKNKCLYAFSSFEKYLQENTVIT